MIQKKQAHGAHLPGVAVSQTSPKLNSSNAFWLTGLILVCLIPLCFLGYGSDSDTYAVLHCGSATWHDHKPCMSRDPGYWTYEAVAYTLSTSGGYLLSNLASLLVAAVVFYRFNHLALRLGIRNPDLLTACLAVTPVVIIASTSTMDYLWSLLCIVLCAEMLLAEKLIFASLLGGLAISFRPSNGLIVGSGFAALILHELTLQRGTTWRLARLALSGILAAVFGSLTFIASYKVAGNSMSFLTPLMGDPAVWTLKLRLGKFLYKSLYAFGPIAVLILLVACMFHAKRRSTNGPDDVDLPVSTDALLLTTLARGYVFGNLVLYLVFPIEISYLIPGMFFLLLLAVTYFRSATTLLIMLFASILSLNFILPQFARPNVPEAATSATFGLHLVPGTLLQDIRARHQLLGCKDVECWKRRQALPPHQ